MPVRASTTVPPLDDVHGVDMEADETPNDFRWTYNSSTGEEDPHPLVHQYLENLTSVGHDRLSDKEWAARHGLADRTLRRWKKDERFRKLWAKMADESVLGPDALSPIYQAALKIAADPDHPKWDAASKMILSLADKVRPPQIQISVSAEDRFQSMSDEQLQAYLAQGKDVLEIGPA